MNAAAEGWFRPRSTTFSVFKGPSRRADRKSEDAKQCRGAQPQARQSFSPRSPSTRLRRPPGGSLSGGGGVLWSRPLRAGLPFAAGPLISGRNVRAESARARGEGIEGTLRVRHGRLRVMRAQRHPAHRPAAPPSPGARPGWEVARARATLGYSAARQVRRRVGAGCQHSVSSQPSGPALSARDPSSL